MNDYRYHQPASRRLRAGRHSQPGQVYHVRFSTFAMRQTLLDLYACRVLAREFKQVQRRRLADTLAYVVMPDHVHWLCTLGSLTPLSKVVGGIKARASSALSRHHSLSPPIWQSGYFDRALRKQEDVRVVADYIVANPLRRGLVDDLADYPHWDLAWL